VHLESSRLGLQVTVLLDGRPKFAQVRWNSLCVTVTTEPDITIWWSYWLLVLGTGTRKRPWHIWKKHGLSPSEKEALDIVEHIMES